MMLAGRAWWPAGIKVPLRVSPVNPRYFVDDTTGRAVLLCGSHTWNNCVDMDDVFPATAKPFRYWSYLNFLAGYRHNFFRLWRWETPKPNDGATYARRVYVDPHPWNRSGGGVANDGLARFDLTDWNQGYFDRLASRVSQARARGIYVSVMLFEGWGAQFAAGANTHPFVGANNSNSIDVGATLTDMNTLSNSAITTIQEAYVARVIDAVNQYPNVLYEICNEPGASYSTSFESHFIDYVHTYEATKPLKHPVGMTFQFPGGVDSTLFGSNAEWISPGDAGSSYLTNPLIGDGSKIIISDNDHLGGSSSGDRQWIWKSFLRGLNALFMDRYDLPDSIAAGGPIANAVAIRLAMGDARGYADRVDLLHMLPSSTASSTTYALVKTAEMLVYNVGASAFTVDLSAASALTFNVEWFDTINRVTSTGSPQAGGNAAQSFTPPYTDALLYLKAQ